MATAGDVSPYTTTVTGPTGSVWWAHAYAHAHHVHALAYCAPCDAVYCMGCARQWGGRAAYTYTSTTITSALHGSH